MTEYEKIAQLIFKDVDKTPEYYESIYPERELKEGQRVTRLAPSPTGYLHFGVLFTCLINRRVADASDGIFFLRIEDTDAKREVEGGMEDIINGLIRFGIKIDEGFVAANKSEGIYAPYKQSERAKVYHCFAKLLMEQGLAYPCFCSEQSLAATRETQEKAKQLRCYSNERTAPPPPYRAAQVYAKICCAAAR